MTFLRLFTQSLHGIEALAVSGDSEDDTALGRLVTCLSIVIKVFCNLSHDNGKITLFALPRNAFPELCIMRLSSMDGFLQSCMRCITHVAPTAVPAHKRFDLQLLVGSIKVAYKPSSRR